jgi:hypothetical protein
MAQKGRILTCECGFVQQCRAAHQHSVTWKNPTLPSHTEHIADDKRRSIHILLPVLCKRVICDTHQPRQSLEIASWSRACLGSKVRAVFVNIFFFSSNPLKLKPRHQICG